MTIGTKHRAREKGIALVYVGVFLVPLLICTGLAVDLGRGYLVRVALAKAVDAAALAVARNINEADSGVGIANNIFSANFPPDWVTPNPQPLIDIKVDDADGSYVIKVTSTATLPTTFMRLAKFDTLSVGAGAVARRRLVDMSFVIDRSASLGSAFPQVQQAAIDFVHQFTAETSRGASADRIALITFSGGTKVEDPMTAERGFDEGKIDADIHNAHASGPTATAEALYQAWDQLRGVPVDSQNSLRIIVLFTDGTPNAFPGNFMVSASKTGGTCNPLLVPASGTIVSIDYPKIGDQNDKNGTSNHPYTIGLYQTDADTEISVPPTNVIDWAANGSGYRSANEPGPPYDTQLNRCIPYLPQVSLHGFPLVDNLGGQRPLFLQDPNGYPDHVLNVNNAARNLAEIIANAIRSDTLGRNGTRIRIYTLGLGELLDQTTGWRPETGASILQRIANDPASPDHDPTQLDGQYFPVAEAGQLGLAFSKVADQIYRLSE